MWSIVTRGIRKRGIGARRTNAATSRRTRVPTCESLEPRHLLAAFELGAYELYIDDSNGLPDPDTGPDVEAKDFSGVAYTYNIETDADSLFIVDDDAGEMSGGQLGTIKGLYEYSLDGAVLREISLVGFDSPEAIVHMDGNNFAIMEEANITSTPPTKEITLVAISASTTQINKNAADKIVIDGPSQLFEGGSNDGPEGLAYDPNGGDYGIFYIAKEKDNPRLFEVVLDENMNAAEVNEIVVPGITGPAASKDLSDIFYADGDLFVVSDKGQRVFRIDLATNTVVGDDINRSGEVDGLDVDPFVTLIAAGGDDPNDPFDQELGDMNDDGFVNGLDVDLFVDVVLGGYEAILEPFPELTGNLDLPGA